jgi:hypothetical protein
MGDNANYLALVAGTGADSMGIAYFAPAGTAVPTTATEVKNVAFLDAGHLTEDGFTFNAERSVKEIKAAGSNLVQRVLMTDEKTTFELAFLETNTITAAVFAGKSLTAVTADGTGALDGVTYGATTPIRYALVLEYVDGSNINRFCCPDVEMSSRGSRKIANSEVDTRSVTLTAYPDDSGNATYEYPVVANLAGS